MIGRLVKKDTANTESHCGNKKNAENQRKETYEREDNCYNDIKMKIEYACHGGNTGKICEERQFNNPLQGKVLKNETEISQLTNESNQTPVFKKEFLSDKNKTTYQTSKDCSLHLRTGSLSKHTCNIDHVINNQNLNLDTDKHALNQTVASKQKVPSRTEVQKGSEEIKLIFTSTVRSNRNRNGKMQNCILARKDTKCDEKSDGIDIGCKRKFDDDHLGDSKRFRISENVSENVSEDFGSFKQDSSCSCKSKSTCKINASKDDFGILSKSVSENGTEYLVHSTTAHDEPNLLESNSLELDSELVLETQSASQAGVSTSAANRDKPNFLNVALVCLDSEFTLSSQSLDLDD